LVVEDVMEDILTQFPYDLIGLDLVLKSQTMSALSLSRFMDLQKLSLSFPNCALTPIGDILVDSTSGLTSLRKFTQYDSQYCLEFRFWMRLLVLNPLLKRIKIANSNFNNDLFQALIINKRSLNKLSIMAPEPIRHWTSRIGDPKEIEHYLKEFPVDKC